MAGFEGTAVLVVRLGSSAGDCPTPSVSAHVSASTQIRSPVG